MNKESNNNTSEPLSGDYLKKFYEGFSFHTHITDGDRDVGAKQAYYGHTLWGDAKCRSGY